ncbi:S24 family peptidase [Alsobacter sp. KACC 23698]|uniref:S24 family peptidase n=1 Tax=Alsobacter sp. KACC 23698 TaxID=3149229 RepID=A0AAU7J8L4_9HYPH
MLGEIIGELHGRWNTNLEFYRQPKNTISVLDQRSAAPYRFGMSELRRIREAKGLSQQKLAELAGTSQPQIRRLEVGERELTKSWADRLAPFLDVRSEDLLYPPDRDSEITRTAEDEADLINVPPAGIVEVDVRAGMGGGGVVQHAYVRNGVEVTTVDALKPEPWLLPSSFVRDELRAPAARLVVLETQGDSMSPTIEPGERVFVDTGHRTPSPDGIYALRDRFGLVIVKRLQVSRGRDSARVRILSDNSNHPEEEVGLEEIEVVGRVVAAIKRH